MGQSGREGAPEGRSSMGSAEVGQGTVRLIRKQAVDGNGGVGSFGGVAVLNESTVSTDSSSQSSDREWASWSSMFLARRATGGDRRRGGCGSR